ncbi:MAG: ABC transporter ATP-binding protein [Fimbriiglobus sp.]
MSLAINGLTKDYTTRSGTLPVLRGVNLELASGEAAVIMGPSGSGKSTLLHILGTLDTPTAGTVNLAGTNPFAQNATDLASFRNTRIGFIFQDHHLLPQCNVLENVLIPTLVNPTANPAELETRARELLVRVGLKDRLEHRPAELSGGERQRAAVARALIHHPALLLADEPTGNLDRSNAQLIGELLLELPRELNAVLVVVTHSQDLAKLFAKRFEMNEGQLHPHTMAG